MDAKPALQTSSNKNEIDISATEAASHVYVKVEEPKGLSARFEGPYRIVSRPSRSQVEVRIGSYANGLARTATYHWSSCKIAHMREGAQVGQRPKLGRPSASTRPPPPTDDSLLSQDVSVDARKPVPKPQQTSPDPSSSQPANTITTNNKGAKIQTRVLPKRSSRNQNPVYVD